jgi:peptidoglycan/LPS O-acetylase OafA/YrhL
VGLESADVVRLGYRIRQIGDITYGLYLWHVPVQISMILAVSLLEIDRSFFKTGQGLALYVAISVLVAYFSFVFIEAPARAYLRRFASGYSGLSARVD